MLIVLTIVVAFYALLSVLPREHLPAFRTAAAIPVACIVYLSLALLTLVGDGRDGLKSLGEELRTLAREIFS